MSSQFDSMLHRGMTAAKTTSSIEPNYRRWEDGRTPLIGSALLCHATAERAVLNARHCKEPASHQVSEALITPGQMSSILTLWRPLLTYG